MPLPPIHLLKIIESRKLISQVLETQELPKLQNQVETLKIIQLESQTGTIRINETESLELNRAENPANPPEEDAKNLECNQQLGHPFGIHFTRGM